jgi:hypothetical protein
VVSELYKLQSAASKDELMESKSSFVSVVEAIKVRACSQHLQKAAQLQLHLRLPEPKDFFGMCARKSRHVSLKLSKIKMQPAVEQLCPCLATNHLTAF